MNPFEKRASEHIKDDLAFLPYITPEPLLSHLEQHAKEKSLFERLMLLIGSPGSGKTTLARLFTFPTLTTLIRKHTSVDPRKALTDALTKCGALIAASTPAVAGLRIPMESGYRGIWDLPYDEGMRNSLMFSLIQSRALLGWLRGFEQDGIALADVKLIARPDAVAALEAIGGTESGRLREFARRVERETYQVTASLSPPAQDRLPTTVTAAYSPFDVIEAFEIPHGEERIRVKPLLICDDANNLHPHQLAALVRWLARRELIIARWILMRIDALQPQEALRPEGGPMSEAPGLDLRRETTRIWMQNYVSNRLQSRRAFRKIAADMARRYLAQMPIFARKQLTDLEHLLDAEPPRLTQKQQDEIRDAVMHSKKYQVGSERRKQIVAEIDAYFANEKGKKRRSDVPEVRLVMERILLERYLKRIPQGSLFLGETSSPEPSSPLEATRDIELAAQMQLHHQFGRPIFYGLDALCDAASENAERFLRLAAPLVDRVETQLTRSGQTRLSAAIQNKLLEERANQILTEDDFPEKTRVLRLADEIARQCREKSLEANASLGDGANAWGILQEKFDEIHVTDAELARVLQYGTAYNVFAIVRDYGTKGRTWALVELTGTYSLARGLTLNRGGFLEREVDDLSQAMDRKG
jgi:hypothetical protein